MTWSEDCKTESAVVVPEVTDFICIASMHCRSHGLIYEDISLKASFTAICFGVLLPTVVSKQQVWAESQALFLVYVILAGTSAIIIQQAGVS